MHNENQVQAVIIVDGIYFVGGVSESFFVQRCKWEGDEEEKGTIKRESFYIYLLNFDIKSPFVQELDCKLNE